jgi:hypothetical protein
MKVDDDLTPEKEQIIVVMKEVEAGPSCRTSFAGSVKNVVLDGRKWEYRPQVSERLAATRGCSGFTSSRADTPESAS